MGINSNIVYVQGAKITDLEALGLGPTGETMTGDEALLCHDGLRALEIKGGVLVADGELSLVAEPEKVSAVLGRKVVAAMLGSTGDTYSLAVVERGAGAAPTLTRHLVDSYGERVVDHGEPLPEEAGMTSLGEDSILDLFEKLTGVVVFADNILFASFSTLGNRQAETPRKGLFGRLFGR